MDVLAEPTCLTEVNMSFVAIIYYQDRDCLHVPLCLIAVATLVLENLLICFPPGTCLLSPSLQFLQAMLPI